MGNPWMDIVSKVKKENPKLSFKQVLIKAKGLYQTVKKSVSPNKQTKRKKQKKQTKKKKKKSKSKKSKTKKRRRKKKSRK
tara:strand:+ start:319 stop:558 length:240 start_codon:yes stop_codon:yes gene_type:complete